MKHRLLTVNEAAQFKGVSRTAIYSAITRKKLPRRYSRGNLVLREADLLEWDATKTKGGRPRGRRMSEASKQLLSQAQKKRWAERKKASEPDKVKGTQAARKSVARKA